MYISKGKLFAVAIIDAALVISGWGCAAILYFQ